MSQQQLMCGQLCKSLLGVHHQSLLKLQCQKIQDTWKSEFVFVDLDGLLQVDDGSTEDLTQVQYELPPHQRYAVHILNLVMRTDVHKYL